MTPPTAGALTVIVKLNVVLAMALLALTTYAACPVGVVAVPEITPVVVLSVRPEGRAGLTE
jgi:hypothetical protein